MGKKEIEWLLGELPRLVSKRVISGGVAQALKKHYAADVKSGKGDLALIIFGTIGAVLIGLGIILLFAYNWGSLSRSARTVLCFIPLVVSQLLGIWVRKNKSASVAWREGVGIFWALSIGSCIALISQTYHMPGNMKDFLLTWALLGAPVIYLMNSVVTATLYLVCITSYASAAQLDSGHALLFWPLLCIALPYYVKRIRRQPELNSTYVLSWMACVCLTIALGVSLEKCVPGLWIVIYASFFFLMYQLGVMIHRRDSRLIQKPFYTYGLIALVFYLWELTGKWPWEKVGWNYYRCEDRFHEYAALVDYAFLVLLPLAALLIARRNQQGRRPFLMSYSAAPILVIISYVLIAWNAGSTDTVVFILNVFFLALCVQAILRGIKERSLLIMNSGMAMFCFLVTARFFDSDMSFLTRGIIFVILGVMFLVANAVLVRRGEVAK